MSHSRPQKVLISAEEIQSRVQELATQIASDVTGAPAVVVGILNGAAPFMMDLLRLLPASVASTLVYDFVDATSYRGSESTGEVQLSHPLGVNIAEQEVLVVDGIVDTGATLQTVLAVLKVKRPTSIRTCVLLDKVSRRKFDVPVDYRGFEIEDLFVVGYGMDFDGQFRGLRHVAVHSLST